MATLRLPAVFGGHRVKEVDFSAKSYSRKKSLELKTTFSQKQRHVSEIIKLMNDKGVGGIDLKGVNVEAL